MGVLGCPKCRPRASHPSGRIPRMSAPFFILSLQRQRAKLKRVCQNFFAISPDALGSFSLNSGDPLYLHVDGGVTPVTFSYMGCTEGNCIYLEGYW